MTQKPTITLGDCGQNIEIARVITFSAPLEMSRMIIYITYEGMDKELEIPFSDEGEYQDGILKLTDARDAYLAGQEAPPALVNGVRICDITWTYRDGSKVYLRRFCQENQEKLFMDSSDYNIFYNTWKKWQQYAAMQSLR